MTIGRLIRIKTAKALSAIWLPHRKKTKENTANAGDIYVIVTHRPAEKSFDVVNFVAGYTYKNGSQVVVKIGKDTFTRLFTDGDKAWAIDDKADKELVAAMKRGQRWLWTAFPAKGRRQKTRIR